MLRNYNENLDQVCFYRDTVSFEKYYVDLRGNIFIRSSNGDVRIVNPIEIEGQRCIYFQPLNRNIRIANIVNYAFKGLYKDMFEELMSQQIIFIDGNSRNVHPSNMAWGNANSKDDEEGFRMIPGFVQYKINRNGLIKTNRGGFLEGRPTPGSSSANAKTYLKINLKSDVCKKFNKEGKELPYVLVSIHRLMALAYLPIPPNFYKLDVSHINDNSLDNRVENLEWVSRSANNARAVENNLIAGTNPVLIRNFGTGEVSRFNSIGSCARHFNVHVTKITTFCKSKGQKTFPNGYQFCRESEFTEWGTEDYDYKNDNATRWQEAMRKKAIENFLGVKLPVTLVTKETGKIVRLETMDDLKNFYTLKEGYYVIK